jgi:hypothetical protein
MLHVYVYYYFSMNLCIYIMHLSVYILYIKFHKSSMCIYFHCMQFEKCMWHSSVGCWVCYNIVSENEIVFWSSMTQNEWSKMLQYGIKDSVFNTEPRWVEQVELKRKVTEDLFQSGQISSERASMVKFRSNDAELRKAPIYVVKFMGKLRNLAEW